MKVKLIKLEIRIKEYLKEYLDKIKPYLKDVRNNLKHLIHNEFNQ